MEKKICICGRPIVGRIDKKYCSDACRYFENNKEKFKIQGPILSVNKTLRRNRSILKTLCPTGKTTVRREVMEKMGYDVRFFSSLFLTSRKQVYYICYDYAFTPVLEKGIEKALIVTRQHYMDQWNPWKFVKP